METTIGSIMLFPYDFVPAGWLACHGQELEKHRFEVLANLLGTRFGGDGHKHFALPNLKDKAPADGLRYCICVEGTYPLRA